MRLFNHTHKKKSVDDIFQEAWDGCMILDMPKFSMVYN